MKRRLSDLEKEQLGYIIHYYRNAYFHDKNEGYEHYKQVNFCKNICSQAQLSRLEHGEVLKDVDLYYSLLDQLNLKIEKTSSKLINEFDLYFSNINKYQNDDQLIINYNQYILAINKFQNEFRHNIVYTHYTYALEFIIYIINEEYSEANSLLEDIEGTLEILPKKYLFVLLQYIGRYYAFNQDFENAIKYYLSSKEYMISQNEYNPIIYMDIGYTYMKQNKGLNAISYLNQCNHIFKGTHNFNILERLYNLFGLLYLKNGYYDLSQQFFRDAIKYSLKVNKPKILSKNIYYLALNHYLEEDIKKADRLIRKSLEHYNFEKSNLLYFLIHGKEYNEKKRFGFKISECRLTYDFFCQSDDTIEDLYTKKVKKSKCLKSEDLILLIRKRMLRYYKEHKKYKKALKLLESYPFD